MRIANVSSTLLDGAGGQSSAHEIGRVALPSSTRRDEDLEHFPITNNRKMLREFLLCRVFEPENRLAWLWCPLPGEPVFLKTLEVMRPRKGVRRSTTTVGARSRGSRGRSSAGL